MLLDQNESCNLRPDVTVTRRDVRTNKFETVSRIGSILWGKLPKELQNAARTNIFKHEFTK